MHCSRILPRLRERNMWIVCSALNEATRCAQAATARENDELARRSLGCGTNYLACSSKANNAAGAAASAAEANEGAFLRSFTRGSRGASP